jgi:hypothetical protein
MLKDLSYALELAEQNGLDLRNARLAGDLLREAIAAGHGEEYWPTVLHVIDRA